jgi:hypothetical protein
MKRTGQNIVDLLAILRLTNRKYLHHVNLGLRKDGKACSGVAEESG